MNERQHDLDELKKRLDQDLAAGKTVVLGSSEMDDPALREQLPQLLEELAQVHQRQSLSPLKLPGYTLLGEIGRGGMSTVHLARHETLRRTVAIKITPNWLAADARSRNRLLMEARSLALVNHPNVVRIYDIIDIDDAFAIAMEWVDGYSLARLIRTLPAKHGPTDMTSLIERLGTPPQQVAALEPSTTRCFAKMMRDIALATQCVHDVGLLHQDIKPSNVLVRRDGTPLLADFGVVRQLDYEHTHTRTFAGTPVYAAPEQLRRDDHQIGPPTDVYAIGLTLFELLAREQPLRDLDLPSIAKTVEAGRFPPLSTFVKVPDDLANIVQMAIAPEPHNRYQTASALAADLTAFLENRPVVARPLSRTQRLRRWVRTEPWKATFAAALAVLLPALLALGGYLLWQWPQLERIQADERRAEANRLKNEAFQGLLFMIGDDADNNQLLRRAAELEDGDTSLACRLLYSSLMHADGLAAEMEQQSHRIAAHQALRLFARRHTEGRTFFSDAESAELTHSADPIDHYVLAIDRVLLARDSQMLTHWLEAAKSIQLALVTTGPDELLHGLMVWTALQAADPALAEMSANALERLWPNKVTAVTWLAGSQLQSKSIGAEATLARLTQLSPNSRATHSMHLLQSTIAGDWRGVLEIAENMRRDGLETRGLQRLVWAAAANSWAVPFLATVGELFPEWTDRFATARSTVIYTPERAPELFECLLHQDLTPQECIYVYRACVDTGHETLSTLVQDHCITVIPDRRRMDTDMMQRFAKSRDIARGAPIARRWRPKSDEISLVTTQLMILATARDWPVLNDAARYWFSISEGNARREAACYIALAESRMGNSLVAAEFSGIALSAELKRSCWVNAWLEEAWLHADPNAPAELHEQARAMDAMKRFQHYNQQLRRGFRGPWINGIQAHVYLANNMIEEARTLFEKGKAVLDRGVLEVGSPDLEWVRARYDWLAKKLK